MSQIVDSDALKGMSPDDVAAALADGRLDALIGGVNLRRGEELTPVQWKIALENMSVDEIAAATDAGLLEPLLGEAPTAADADQGARGKRPGTTRERLRGMTADQIAAGLERGDFSDLLSGRAR
jgi:hypothetical protein